MDVVRRRVLVGGRVQGVFFRDGTRREATARGLAGYAQNLPGGQVEVVLEGPAEEVDAVVGWLHRGTPHARVDSVRVTDEEPEGTQGFSVR